MKIYTKQIGCYDIDPNLDIEIDLEFITEKNKHFTDFIHLIHKKLYIKNRNINIKIIDKSYYVMRKNKLVEYIFIEVSNKEFEVEKEEEYDYIDEHDVSDIICLSDNNETKKKYVYIDSKTNTKYFIHGEIFSFKTNNSKYFRLIPCSKWFVNDIHLITICRDYSCDETKGFYVDKNNENKLLFDILYNVFEYINDYDNEFYSYYVSTNTDRKIGEIKEDIDNFIKAFL